MANPSAHESSSHPTLGLYVVVYASLLVLTTLTFGVSQFAPKTVHMPAAILIASTKATLVALFFMHLKYSTGATRMTMVLALGLVLLLLAGVLGDVYTRFPLTNSNDSELSGVSEKAWEARKAYGPQPPQVEEHH